MLSCAGSVLGGKLTFLPQREGVSMTCCNASMEQAAEVRSYLSRGERSRRCLNAAGLAGVVVQQE